MAGWWLLFPLTERNGGQFHDRIGHGEFGRGRYLGGLVLADPQRCGREGGQTPGQLVQELAEPRVTVG